MKLTDEQIAVIARHAGEGAALQARHQNERIDLMDKQRRELAAAGVDVSGNASAAGNLQPQAVVRR